MNDDQSSLPEPSKYIEAHLSLDSLRVTLRHHLWLSLMLLDLFRWDLSNDTGNVIIGVSMCL